MLNCQVGSKESLSDDLRSVNLNADFMLESSSVKAGQELLR